MPRVITVLFFVFAGVFVRAGDPNGAPCVLRFLNDDLIHGFLSKVTPDSGIDFESPSFHRPVRFKLRRVGSLEFSCRGGNSGSVRRGKVRVDLNNGDFIYCDSIVVGASSATLSSSAAGAIPIARSMLRSVRFEHSLSVIHYGFSDLRNWNVNRRGSRSGCVIKNGTLIARGSVYISAKFKLPEVARIDFDIPCDTSLYLFLRPKTFKRYSSRCHALYLDVSGDSAYFYENGRGGEGRRIGRGVDDMERFAVSTSSSHDDDDEECSERLMKRPWHITIIDDKPGGRLQLFINYQIAITCSDVKNVSDDGAGFAFLMCDSSSLHRMKNLRVMRWSMAESVVPPETAGRGVAERGRGDELLLTNADRISGKLAALNGREAEFQMKYAKIAVPLKDIAEIRFAGAGRSEAKTASTEGAVRVLFADGGRFTLPFKSIDASAFRGGGAFDGVAFPIAIIKRIEFNLGLMKKRASDKVFFADLPAEKIPTEDDSNDDDENEVDFFDNF